MRLRRGELFFLLSAAAAAAIAFGVIDILPGAERCSLCRPAPAAYMGARSAETSVSQPQPSSAEQCPQKGQDNCSVAAIEEQVLPAIYAGHFDAADDALCSLVPPDCPPAEQLHNVVAEHHQLQDSRQAARKQAWEEQFEQLEELRGEGLQDVNDIPEVFSVVLSLQKLADPNQKERLFDDPFVQKTIEKAKEQAAEYESQGKWLEAYTRCYYWLKQLDGENTEYSEHAEKLSQMALIKSSLQDSPCETWRQRHEGIEPDMFTRTVKWLDSYHVKILDYEEMAETAVKRCRLLGQVLRGPDGFENGFPVPKGDQISAWLVGIDVLLDEVRNSALSTSRDEFIELFEKVLSLNKTTLELPEAVIVQQFAEASLEEVDRYTNLIWPWQVQEFQKNLTKEFTGIGIEISRAEGPLKVVSLLPDTPAYTSGLDAGDIIEAVDGVSTAEMTLYCAVRKITGPEGTEVTLTVRHPTDNEIEDITITRDRIIVPTVRGWQRTETADWKYYIDPNNHIAYINITDFAESTAANFENVLERLEETGLNGLVLDLRFNPGGYLESGVDVVDKLIEEGKIVSSRPRFGISRIEQAHKEGTHPGFPLVVLINSSSASASEIVGGALGDAVHERAILVGTRSFGKGSVQTINGYPGGGAQLKYTMAYYHLPSGQPVLDRNAAEENGDKNWGVAPDVEVKLRDDELTKMLDIQRDNNVLVKKGHDLEKAPIEKHSLEQTLAADPQLKVALLILRAKMVGSRLAACKN